MSPTDGEAAADIGQVVAVGAIAGAALVGHRTYTASDEVVEVAENQTVEVIEALGDAGVSVAPMII